jgi:hypothetical protein
MPLQGRWHRTVFAAMAPAATPMEEPLGRAAHAAPHVTTSGELQSLVTFLGQGGGLRFFVGEVALGGSQLGLAGLANRA